MRTLDFDLIDLPIEYKEINPEDFDSNFYTVSEKRIIEPDEAGYLTKEIENVVREGYDEKNTVVINCGVGQGKTTAVINMIQNYLKFDEYIVILAVPYKSLIKQYVEQLLKRDGISKDEVFNLQDIDSQNQINITDKYSSLVNPETGLLGFGYIDDSDFINPFKISDYRVHIMSINSLLGNPGDNNLFQAGKKVAYFGKLKTYCEKNNKKMIVFYDEIHDSIHNFNEEYLFKLWKYKGLIHKQFVVSATFNEASKEVVKYLSEFTDRKIQIIESARLKIPGKQSRLHLIFNSKRKISENEHFISLLLELNNDNKPLDVIVYSKKQIDSIFKNEDILKIFPKSKSIKYCSSDIFDKKNDENKFDENYNNIGTNFTTGISIEHEEHNLVLIIPYRTDIEFLNNKGVFSSGANSIIQALARQRKNGDIYIVMPPPLLINKDSLPYSDEINEKIQNVFLKYSESNNSFVNYTNINSQALLLEEVYSKLEQNVKESLVKISGIDRFGMNRLLYPTKEIFILSKGENFLTSNFFNGDLASYTFFAAITNQFQNATLESILKNERVYYDGETQLFDAIVEVYQDLVQSNPFNEEGESYLDYFSYYKLYYDVEHEVIGGKIVYIDNVPASKKQLETIKIYILYLIVYSDIENKHEFNFKQMRQELKGFYLNSCLLHSKVLDINDDNTIDVEFGLYELDSLTAKVVRLYKEWFPFIDLIFSSIEFYQQKGKYKKDTYFQLRCFKNFKICLKRMKWN